MLHAVGVEYIVAVWFVCKYFCCVSQVMKLVRCLKLMIEYVVECDEEYMEERAIPPHGR